MTSPAEAEVLRVQVLSVQVLSVHVLSAARPYYFVFTECALVSMVMSLHRYAYAKNNSSSNTDVVLPSRLRCCIILARPPLCGGPYLPDRLRCRTSR